MISIHAPRAGRDRRGYVSSGDTPNFNPRAPCGARRAGYHRRISMAKFQSTRPVRGATTIWRYVRHDLSDFNPRAPCGARPGIGASSITRSRNFNPRAPCGARLLPPHFSVAAWYFNPRAPCGARPLGWSHCTTPMTFQSTRPVRGATPLTDVRVTSVEFQSTRPVRGATDLIHKTSVAKVFQSTRPVRGATPVIPHKTIGDKISIHAPRAGRDSKSIQNYFTHFCDKRQFLDNFTQNAAF